jgi:CRP/FNR family cyclic AMP-dependent transcriptional regulator
MKEAWHIESFDWLRKLSAESLESLRQKSSRREYAKGEMIFTPTPNPHSVYLLEGGLVRIFRLSRYGDEATFGFVSPGEVFGELAAFGDYPRESFARAVQRSLVWRIPRDVFQGVIADRPDLVVAVIRQVGDRFKRIESRVEHLVFRGVRSRLALILRELADDFGRPLGDGPALEVPLSQAELATLVGASRQSVNVTLHELEKEGLIELGRRRVLLLRPDELVLAVSRDGS